VADGATTRFDFAYITIHGTPGEDGVLQGYFDMLGIPYSNCGVLASALTFNKFTCNNFLKSFGVKVAPSIVLRERDSYTPEQITAELGLPVFVKPNSGRLQLCHHQGDRDYQNEGGNRGGIPRGTGSHH